MYGNKSYTLQISDMKLIEYANLEFAYIVLWLLYVKSPILTLRVQFFSNFSLL